MANLSQNNCRFAAKLLLISSVLDALRIKLVQCVRADGTLSMGVAALLRYVTH
jgi:hypothetical protein